MSCYYIYVDSGQKHARVVSSEAEYRALRSSEEQVRNLQNARNGDQGAKMRLVQFNYSGHYPNGIVRGNKLPSSTFGFDIDDKNDFERVATLLLASPEDYGLLMLERSASQGGHAVFVRERGKTILENQVRVATQLQCEMDTSAHDINRVYFASTADPYDLLFVSPQLFEDEYVEEDVTAEAETLNFRIEDLPPNAHKACKHYRPWLPDEGLTTENTEKTQKFNDDEESAAVSQRNISVPSVVNNTSATNNPSDEMYLGIPYEDIEKKWWQMYNDGQEPVKSNRDVLTFELAVNLRHICGFDRELMSKVIPCYDGFPEAQKMKCIDSALNEKRTQMPKRLKDVLYALRKERLVDRGIDQNENFNAALDEALAEDEAYYYNRLPKMPQGVKDSIDAVGPMLTMPVITAICPCIGTLATGVQLDVHGTKKNLNLISYVVGDFASGKGGIDPVIEAWMGELKALDGLYQQQEKEWRRKKRASVNKKDQPEEPELPVRLLAFNNTVANLAARLANTEGKHAFSFTPEADTVAQRWKSTMSDFSIMLRQSYDGSAYDREAKSADSVNVHIDSLLWNVCLAGTPDALYRVVNNYTDGFQSRIAIARTPDNTFSRLEDKPFVMTDRHKERIEQIAHLLPLMWGEVVLPKLEERGRQWLEVIRMETMKNDDRVKARQRFRVCVTTQRMMCCLMLCKVAETLIQKHGLAGAETRLKASPNLWKEMLLKTQTPQMLEAFDVIADYLIENALFFFRDRIEQAYSSRDYAGNAIGSRVNKGKNDSIFERLDVEFSFEQALQHAIAVKGSGVTRNSVQQMLKNWRKQGLIVLLESGRYRKVG